MRTNAMNCQAGSGARPGAAGERGSALLISLMVMVILTLLGIAYILMAETENQIAVNQRNAGQVLYVAEGGARAAVNWFNSPTGGFTLPATTDVDRTQRWLDSSPAGGDGVWDTAADGTSGKERYKQTTGLMFQKPYRPSIEDTFLGNEDHPDLRITSGTFLDTLNSRMLGTGSGTLADPDPQPTYGKITQIDVYAPPILVVNGSRTRHGVATIKVTAQKIRNIGGTDRVLSERTIKVVVNEINYPAAGGPLQSCSSTGWGGDFTIHWGASSVQATPADFSINSGNLDNKIKTGMPYTTGSPSEYFATAADFDAFYALHGTATIEDPWFKLMVGGLITNISDPGECTNPGGQQPCPYNPGLWTGIDDNSNIFQDQGSLAACPNFDYALFKTVAQRGGAGIYYYGAYNSGTSTWREGGTGTPKTFKGASDNRSGFFFFDTADGNAPTYDAGNNCLNCTNALSYNSADKWGTGLDAFIYLNAVSFGTTGGGTVGYTRTFNAPGEPYFDSNGNKTHDAGEPFMNFDYPAGESDAFTINIGGSRDAQGPNISVTDVALDGIMYLSGTFDTVGNGKYYGAVVAHKVAVTATADMWYNERISTNAWPPPSSPVPKVYVSVWEVDNL